MLDIFDECVVPESMRTGCGDFDEIECREVACCYDEKTVNGTFCYKPSSKIIILLMYFFFSEIIIDTCILMYVVFFLLDAKICSCILFYFIGLDYESYCRLFNNAESEY